MAAPQCFRDTMQTAANILDSTIQNNITVNLQVGYGDWDNGLMTGLDSSAVGADMNGPYVSCSSPRSALASHETSTLDQTVEDASGNAVAGTAVTLSGSGSSNNFGAISGTTDAHGAFTTTLASTLAQNETATAT